MFSVSIETCRQSKIETSLVFDGIIEAVFLLGLIKVYFYKLILISLTFVDIFFNFHITFVNSKGEVVFDRKHIALNYLKGKQNTDK